MRHLHLLRRIAHHAKGVLQRCARAKAPLRVVGEEAVEHADKGERQTLWQMTVWVESAAADLQSELQYR